MYTLYYIKWCTDYKREGDGETHWHHITAWLYADFRNPVIWTRLCFTLIVKNNRGKQTKVNRLSRQQPERLEVLCFQVVHLSHLCECACVFKFVTNVHLNSSGLGGQMSNIKVALTSLTCCLSSHSCDGDIKGITRENFFKFQMSEFKVHYDLMCVPLLSTLSQKAWREFWSGSNHHVYSCIWI